MGSELNPILVCAQHRFLNFIFDDPHRMQGKPLPVLIVICHIASGSIPTERKIFCFVQVECENGNSLKGRIKPVWINGFVLSSPVVKLNLTVLSSLCNSKI